MTDLSFKPYEALSSQGLRRVYFILIWALFGLVSTGNAQMPCSNGVTINVDATIETGYIVSNNWFKSPEQTVGKAENFPSGNFLGTATQTEQRSAEPEDCSYVIQAPQGYYVQIALLAVGLTEGTREPCQDFIELVGTGGGPSFNGDAQYCSAGPWRPDLQSNDVLQYIFPAYLRGPENILSETGILNAPADAPVFCSNDTNVTLNYLNGASNTDESYIGFVVAFRYKSYIFTSEIARLLSEFAPQGAGT